MKINNVVKSIIRGCLCLIFIISMLFLGNVSGRKIVRIGRALKKGTLKPTHLAFKGEKDL